MYLSSEVDRAAVLNIKPILQVCGYEELWSSYGDMEQKMFQKVMGFILRLKNSETLRDGQESGENERRKKANERKMKTR